MLLCTHGVTSARSRVRTTPITNTIKISVSTSPSPRQSVRFPRPLRPDLLLYLIRIIRVIRGLTLGEKTRPLPPSAPLAPVGLLAQEVRQQVVVVLLGDLLGEVGRHGRHLRGGSVRHVLPGHPHLLALAVGE